MKYKQSLTNEALSRQFNSLFELVNYAIKLAGSLVRSGRAPRVTIEEENPAVVILEEIAAGRDLLDDVPDLDATETNNHVVAISKIEIIEEEDEPKAVKKARK